VLNHLVSFLKCGGRTDQKRDARFSTEAVSGVVVRSTLHDSAALLKESVHKQNKRRMFGRGGWPLPFPFPLLASGIVCGPSEFLVCMCGNLSNQKNREG